MEDIHTLLEEYKSLRNEILQTIRLRTEVFFLSIGAFSGLCFWAITNRSDLYAEVSLVLLLLIPYFSYCLLIVLNAKLVRISSYIITFIESTVGDLNWETRVNQLYQQQEMQGFFPTERSLYRIVYLVLSIAAFVLACLDQIGVKELLPTHWDLVVFFVAYVLLICFTWRDREDRRSLSTKWQRLEEADK